MHILKKVRSAVNDKLIAGSALLVAGTSNAFAVDSAIDTAITGAFTTADGRLTTVAAGVVTLVA
ncbi:MAG: hypothetical protein H7836_18100, partial [Magnetococcus sp. YQC-3]